ncbi:MAG: hypothetical protein KC776_02590 [Myxococcales bacterium]|nr:hypothetical protein [Myxococcales bacterium]MCB9581172.1 hypothetical protein [Polyangiaceae bacterium]
MRTFALTLLLLGACAGEPAARVASAEAKPRPAPVPAPEPTHVPSAAPPVAPPPELPSDVKVGVPLSLDVEGSRPLRVVHAPARQTRALIYLHGVCGDVTAVDSWIGAATRHGTLIELLGDTRCKGSTRYRWTSSTAVLMQRIDAALSRVRDARGGLLDVTQVVLIGYSQGAIRAEALAKHYPERFPWVLLGGVPVTPNADSFTSTRSVALLGGQREGLGHLVAGREALEKAGRRVKSFVLPSAGHGEFGPDADRVLGEAFDWLLAQCQADATCTG